MSEKKPGPPTRKAFPVNTVVFLVYLIIALCALGPLDFGNEVWSSVFSDTGIQINTLAIQASEAARGRIFPTFTNDLRYPEGGSLYIADPVGGTLAIPAVWAFGPVVAYNLLILFDLAFAGWAMFWLARRRIGDPWIAFFCGAVYGLNPTLLSDVGHGALEALQAGWLPLFLGTLLSLMDEARKTKPKRKTILALIVASAALWWLATISSHWYYGVAAGLFFGLVLIGQLIVQPASKIIPPALGVLALMFVFILPMGWLFHHISYDPGTLTNKLSFGIWPIHKFNCVDPVSFFPPRPITRLSHGGYLGIILPLIVLAGLLRRGEPGQKRPLWGWLGAALFFTVFSIGPKLFYQGQDVVVNGYTVLLPFHWLRMAFPFLQSIQHPWRYFLFVYLGLGMAAGWSLKGWLSQLRGRPLAVAFLTFLFLWEATHYSGLRTPFVPCGFDTLPIIKALAADPEKFAVVDLPLDDKHMDEYARDKIFHGRPIIYSVLAVPHYYSPSLARDSLIFYLLSRSSKIEDPMRDDSLAGQADALFGCIANPDQPCDEAVLAKLTRDKLRLIELGLTRFVLHRKFIAPDSLLPVVCRYLFGPPIAFFNQTQIFKLALPAIGADGSPEEKK